jgi:hypothetical protein
MNQVKSRRHSTNYSTEVSVGFDTLIYQGQVVMNTLTAWNSDVRHLLNERYT